MKLSEISNFRLLNQKVAKTEFITAKEIISWMGAMQAQDYLMANWAIGTRLINSSAEAIEKELAKGSIIRTHIMRPTWHFVAAEDIFWMLGLTSPQVKSSLRSRKKTLELTDAVISKSKHVIEKALIKSVFLTREELSKEFNESKIRTDNNRLSHILLYAELDGMICSGPLKNKKQTYALLNDRIPYKNILSKDEALAELAKRYFQSHGPATIQDFAWWSGLSAKDSRQALGYIKSDLISEIIETKEYWFTDISTRFSKDKDCIYLLPAYDEFLISYKERSASLSIVTNKKVISENGIFRPVIVISGQISGLWKCTRKNETLYIELEYLRQHDYSIKNKAEAIAMKFADFFGKAAMISYRNE